MIASLAHARERERVRDSRQPMLRKKVSKHLLLFMRMPREVKHAQTQCKLDCRMRKHSVLTRKGRGGECIGLLGIAAANCPGLARLARRVLVLVHAASSHAWQRARMFDLRMLGVAQSGLKPLVSTATPHCGT